MSRMPVLFVGHGSPMNIIEKNRFTATWSTMAAAIPRPRSILCVSAHWFDRGLAVSGALQPETIHDFYGFPAELYDVQYPAPGAPELAERLVSTLPEIRLDPARGPDHGAWSVLHFMYPKADIPVCQLSVNALFSPRQSYEVGQRLSFLRDEGVLILGSGDVVHNLALVNWEMEDGYDWADEFDAYIKAALIEGRPEEVIDYQKAGFAANRSFSYRDHYDPLLYALGAVASDDQVRVFNDERVMGALSMTSYIFG